MAKQQKKNQLTRREFVKQTAVVAGGMLTIPGLSQVADLLPNSEPAPVLRAVVLGDSAMWGQGLAEKDKYAFKALQEIGKLLGREVKTTNLAHSGAPILASDDDREEFLNLYPARFSPKNVRDHREGNLKDDLIKNNKQDIAILMNQEVPCALPDISYQVEMVPDSVARNAEIVLINGGANDIDFEEFLNPEEYRDNFVKHYNPLLEAASYKKLKTLLKKAKQRFPQATIIYTGYFSPFFPNVANDDLKRMLEDFSGQPGYLTWFNSNMLELKNVGRLAMETQYRSQFGFSRSLYWSRRAVNDVNKETEVLVNAEEGQKPKPRGNRVLFIHPQFGPDNTVFGSNSFFHRKYKISEIEDAAKTLREINIPRKYEARDMEVSGRHVHDLAREFRYHLFDQENTSRTIRTRHY